MVDINDQSGQWSMIPPPSLPVTQAIPGMPQAGGGGIGNLLGALLGGGGGMPQQQGLGGLDPRAIQMMLFQQMNKPAQGPFSAIANPIAALLMARQVAPAIAQQQQQQLANERIKQTLEALQAASLIQHRATQGALNTAKTGVLQREAEVTGAIPMEAQVAGEMATRNIIPKPGERERLKQGETRIKLQEEGQKLDQQLAQLQAQRAAWQQQMDAATFGQRERFEGGRREDVRAAREQRGTMHEETLAQKEFQFGQRQLAEETREVGRNLRQARDIEARHGSPVMQQAKFDKLVAETETAKQKLIEAQNNNLPEVRELSKAMELARLQAKDPAQQGLTMRNVVAPLFYKVTKQQLPVIKDTWWPAFLEDFAMFGAPPEGTETAGTPPPGRMPTPTPSPAASTVIPKTTAPPQTYPGGLTFSPSQTPGSPYLPPPGSPAYVPTTPPGNPDAPTNFDDMFQGLR